MFSPGVLITLSPLLYLLFSIISIQFLSHGIESTQNAISSYTIMHTGMVPIHFYIIFLLHPNNALAFFHHRFCLRVQVELVMLKSLRLDALTCTLMNGYLFSGGCSLCSNSHLFSQHIQSPQASFSSVCSTTDGFSFPIHKEAYPNWKWIFKCCFIGFGSMSPWHFTLSA